MGDYSPVMHEEALVARILSQARAIYGPKYPYGSTFDVIYSCNDQNDYCVSWLIVYPQPDVAVVKTEKAVSNDWIPVLKSERMVKNPSVPDLFSTTYLLRDSYRNLIEKLRVQMVETMATMEKTEEAEKLKKDDISAGIQRLAAKLSVD